jgi:dihydrofolate reductase
MNNFSMIYAKSNNNVIGKDNKLLWHLPNDLKRFKELTRNRIVIMGKNTYLSLPNGPLPNRLNVVLCNDDENFLKSEIQISTANTGVAKFSSIENVFQFINNFKMNPFMKNINIDEIFIIGGESIYKLFLNRTKYLYITNVDVDIEGDAFGPNINDFAWKNIEHTTNLKDDNHIYNYDFIKLEKIND